MCYIQQRRNYVARRNKILVCINRNLEKRKDIFLKILDQLNLQVSLQELLPKILKKNYWIWMQSGNFLMLFLVLTVAAYQ